MANEALLSRVKAWVENSALELSLLLRHFNPTPPPFTPGPLPPDPLDLYSLAATWEANIAQDIELVAINLGGSPANPGPYPGGATDHQLLGSMTLSQISLAASLKALLMMYRLQSLPFPMPQSPPYAAEVPLLMSIVGLLMKQSFELKELLKLQGLTPVAPPIPFHFADITLALTRWERALAKMAQDLAYATSQHPRHLIHPLKGYGPPPPKP